MQDFSECKLKATFRVIQVIQGNLRSMPHEHIMYWSTLFRHAFSFPPISPFCSSQNFTSTVVSSIEDTHVYRGFYASIMSRPTNERKKNVMFVFPRLSLLKIKPKKCLSCRGHRNGEGLNSSLKCCYLTHQFRR